LNLSEKAVAAKRRPWAPLLSVRAGADFAKLYQSVKTVPFCLSTLIQSTRVTRLGEYYCFIWAVLKNTKVAQMFGLLFSAVYICVLILTKKGLGYILGNFFKN
jgi:hypothetical protein